MGVDHRSFFLRVGIGELFGLVLHIGLPADDSDKDNEDQFLHGSE